MEEALFLIVGASLGMILFPFILWTIVSILNGDQDREDDR